MKTNNGWIQISVSGDSYNIGYQHGIQLASRLKEVYEIFPEITRLVTNTDISVLMKKSNAVIFPIVKNQYPELYRELEGMVDGAAQQNVKEINVKWLVAWNSLLSMQSSMSRANNAFRKKNEPTPPALLERCSAFIATGNATLHGDIVMAHNTHCDYISAQFFNIIQYTYPTNGHAFVMQTTPGGLCSGSDFFISASGIVGNETTIAGITQSPHFGAPYFCRIRTAMQYGDTLDDYLSIMTENNAGDYASSWQFGDTKTGEIMLLELATGTPAVRRTRNGVFYGMNSPMDYNIREKQTDERNTFNLSKSLGNRRIRLDALLNQKYYGRITVAIAKRVIADHYDTNLSKYEPNSSTICKHSETNFQPFGCVDGKAVNSSMARDLRFYGRFGTSCGKPFIVNQFIQTCKPQYREWGQWMKDRPHQPWSIIRKPKALFSPFSNTKRRRIVSGFSKSKRRQNIRK